MSRHPYITDALLNGDFSNDDFTFIEQIPNPTEEYLLFIVHGIGQTERSLKSILKKISGTISQLYNKKKQILSKQLHVRLINWKYLVLSHTKNNLSKLIDVNNTTKYPKMFINEIPQDILYYLNQKNKYEILNDIIQHMNQYYQLVKTFRPMFKGNVSVVGHSLGGVILYDILRVMTYDRGKKEQKDSPEGKKFKFPEEAIKESKIFYTLEEDQDHKTLKLDRKKRKNTLNNVLGSYSCISNNEKIKSQLFSEKNIKFTEIEKNNYHLNKRFSYFGLQTENYITNSSELFFNFFRQKIISQDTKILPLSFPVDHLFLLGSPLSLFLSLDQKDDPVLEEMEIVKDFHNIIHPMDPVAYRIEPLIEGYEYKSTSFLLPHWENDGVKNVFLDFLTKNICGMSVESEYANHDEKIKCKRYDFMVQENLIEKGFKIIGFLFSHMAYWNNPDVFYFIIKMIHWQGYNELIYNYIRTNKN